MAYWLTLEGRIMRWFYATFAVRVKRSIYQIIKILGGISCVFVVWAEEAYQGHQSSECFECL